MKEEEEGGGRWWTRTMIDLKINNIDSKLKLIELSSNGQLKDHLKDMRRSQDAASKASNADALPDSQLR